MDEAVAPEGFTDWDEERVITRRLGEWRTRGARADLSRRNPRENLLTDAEAERITPALVLGGTDGWRPEENREKD
jgi:pectinesterase